MKHLFVPYQLALKAKEKGFDGPCIAYWFPAQDLCMSRFDLLYNPYTLNNVPENRLLAPLYQQIVDWFREKHNIHLCNNPHFTTSGSIAGYMIDIYSFSTLLNRQESERTISRPTYIETLNAAIEKAFELIP